jgi:hypothetical protein
VTRSATSAAAYIAIEKSGLLGRKQWETYACVWASGEGTPNVSIMPGLTGNEADRIMKTTDAHKRISELVGAGLLVKVGRRKDTITGMMNDVFDVTDRIPTEKVRPRKRVKKPSAEIMRHVARDVRSFYMRAGAEIVPDGTHDRVLAWLEDRT